VLRYLRLFGLFARTELQYELEYRANLAIELFHMCIIVGTSIGAVLVLFYYTDQMNGWTLEQMLVLLGVFYVVQGLEEIVLQPSAEKLMEHIRHGTLDFALLKPVNAQFLVSLRHLQVVQVAQVALGLAVIGLGITRLPSPPPFVAIASFVVMLACGFVLVYALLFVLSTLSFWFVRVDNLLAIFWSFLDAGRFPIDIYPGWLRLTLSTVVPIGIAVTVPAEAIAGRLEPLGVALTVVGTVAAWLFAAWFWKRGLRAYTGASA
jgi:ABC-2 type transport system permease protein